MTGATGGGDGEAPDLARLAPGWQVVVTRGPAGELHARDVEPGTGRQVWAHEVDRPALVLGSTQGLDQVDRTAADALGLEVVKRRSGGGAVLVEPGGAVWVDVVVPPDDPLWDDDVARAAHWVGDAWAEALRSLGVDGARVHRGPLVSTRWSRLVCFAGLGPGEVTVAGRKVVGLSQRRTRAGARFQTAALLRWEPGPLVGGLRLGDAERVAVLRDVADVAAGVPLDGHSLLEAFLRSLPA